MYRAIDIAKYVVTKCVRDSHPISNLRLQEILYYLQKNILVLVANCLEIQLKHGNLALSCLMYIINFVALGLKPFF